MYELGIDIGGTYTDLVLIDVATGRCWLEKTLTTKDAPWEGVEHAIASVLPRAGISGADLQRVVHGTTLVINAVIERRGCQTGLLVTQGFGDLLEMRRGRRFDMDDLLIEVPQPLVPHALVEEIPERMTRDGTPERAVDAHATERAVRRLKDAGVESIAVCLLHAYLNPAHEKVVKSVVTAVAPDVAVSVSSDVAPDIREYERSSTTAANAYVLPLFSRYIGQFRRGLSHAGYGRSLRLMTSDGGLFDARHAQKVPVRFLESGPAGGCCAARHLAPSVRCTELIAFDMGGTTAKVSLIAGGDLTLTNELEVARQYRFKKGSGLPMRIPSVEMMEIGAGGGSIARINQMGLLEVGPESAGADPGPACYGRGGSKMTVTDANLILGYFGERPTLGGGLSLDREAAWRAAASVGGALDLDVRRVAWGVHELVSQDMANAARLHLLDLGIDPRSIAMLAFGGAGPQHACRVARKLGIRKVIIPEAAGVLSAYGFLVAPPSATLVRGWPGLLQRLDAGTINRLLAELEQEARALALDADTSSPADCRFFASLRYVGQSNELRLAVPRNLGGGFESLEATFHGEYQRVYGRSNPSIEVEAMNWGVTVSCAGSHAEAPVLVDEPAMTAAESASAYFDEVRGYVDCPVMPRAFLNARALAGPALVRERATTTVVPPGSEVRCDEYGNLIVQLH